MTVILRQLDHKLCELKEKYAKKADKAMLIHMEWTRYLTGAVYCVVTDNDDPAIVIDPAVQVHCCAILQTIGKYIYIHKSKEIKNTVSAVKLDVKEQTDSGLLLLGSGCVGQMFRLYKKKRCKYMALLKPLAMMLADKKTCRVPKEIASRDRGGLYVIKSDFLPGLRLLDLCAIMSNLHWPH